MVKEKTAEEKQKNRDYVTKYRATKKQYSVYLDREEDAGIIAYIDNHPNTITQIVRSLIAEEIRKEKEAE